MTVPREDLPSWKRKKFACLQDYEDSLLPHERAEKLAARDEIRARAKARRNGRVSINERIIVAHFIEGKTPVEIGAEFGWTERNARLRAASLGIPLTSRAGQRRAPSVWLTEDAFFALSRVAEDLKASLPDTLTKALLFLAENEGSSARKLLRAPARGAAPTGGTAAA